MKHIHMPHMYMTHIHIHNSDTMPHIYMTLKMHYISKLTNVSYPYSNHAWRVVYYPVDI